MSKTKHHLSGSITMQAMIGRLYDAAADDALWPEVSASLARLVSADFVFMQARPMPDRVQILSTNISAEILASSLHWAKDDPWYVASLPLPRERAYLDDELVPERVMKKTAFHNEFLKPVLGATHFVGSATSAPLGAIGLFRATDAKPFGAAERDTLSVFTGHYRRALALRVQLDVARTEAALSFAVLDTLATPIVITTGEASITRINRAAEKLFERKAGLRISNRPGTGVLEGGTSTETRALHLAIHRVIAGNSAETDCYVRLSRPNNQQSYIAHVAPLPRGYNEARKPAEPLVMVIISDPDATHGDAARTLRTLFGLTAAEARVACALAGGASLAEIADLHQVGQPTVRSQLSNILLKMGAKRQAEVVRIMLSLPTSLARDPDDSSGSCSA